MIRISKPDARVSGCRFYPNIYKKEEIFRQEGWHYELRDEESPLCYNGVVYTMR